MKHKNTGSIVVRTLLKNPWMSGVLLVVTLLVVVLNLTPPQLLRLIIDRNLIPQNRDGLWNLALLYLLVTVFIGVFDFLKSGVLVIFGQKIVKQIRMEMNGKLQRLGMQYFTKNSAAEITSRFNSDVENVNALFSEGLISMMIDCLKIVGIVISIALFSLQLGLLALLLIPLISVITRNFQRKLLIAHTQNLKQLGRVNHHISESMKNIFMIKAYSKEEYMEGLYEKRLQDNFTTIERVNFYDSCYAPIIQLIRAAVISAVVLLSFGQQSVLGISLGMVAASIDLIANLFAPVEALGMELQSIQKGISGAKRIDEFLGQSEAEEKDRQITAEAICAPESTAAFAFEGVSFSYADAEKPVLSEITLTIEPGESVTFAGRTGVGKTTLFKLIMGLEKPTQGHITLGGVDVCKIPNDQKRRLLGYVEQNFSFVEGTVAQQISLDEEGITREQVEKALAFVGLLDSINAMEAGLDTPIKSQDDFSQGQKQLLAIARAIVTNPPVLLLDEVTANLDSTTEESVVRILGEVGQKRTILSVSHRLTSLLHCDRIVMLEDGRIRRIGTPTELASLLGTN